MQPTWRALAAGLVALGLAGPVAAQKQLEGRTLFEAAFFVPFAPATALDIVNRTPGFRLEDIDPEVRGFGQAAGNVVLNGQRPSAKRDSLETILSRIPAARVLRVEVASGDLFGAEFTGRAQVLNLVLVDDGGLSGTVQGTVRRSVFDEVKPEGQASAVWKRGNVRLNLALEVDNSQTSERGTDELRRADDGRLLELREKTNRIDDPELTLTFGLAHDGGAGRQANLNLRADAGWFALAQENHVTPAVGPVRDDRLQQNFDSRAFEAGGDISRPLGGGVVKLVGLLTRSREDNSEESLIRPGGVTASGFAQDGDIREAETLGRLVWSGTAKAQVSVEAGGELALNRLDSDVRLFALDASGGRTPLPLPVAQATVEELRGELFLNAGVPLGTGGRLDAGLTYERSKLTVSGDAEARRTLGYLKPKLSLDWRRPGWRFQLSLIRSVAQLDFGDFVGAAELANERIDGGNPELVPQQSWELLAVAERTLLVDGVWRVELGGNRITDVQDRVPVEGGFDAPGNLGTGRSFIARTNVDLPLARLGAAALKGMRLTGRFSLVATSVEDPYTGEDRPFSGSTLWVADLGVRQDLGAFAWGVTAFANSGQTSFRRNEEDSSYNGGPYLEAFGEWRPTARTTVRLFLDNLLATTGNRERTFFTPDRSAPEPDLVERRVRNKYVVPSLTVSHSFG